MLERDSGLGWLGPKWDNGGSEEELESLYVLKIEPTGFAKTLHARFERAESNITPRFWQGQWKGWSCHLPLDEYDSGSKEL